MGRASNLSLNMMSHTPMLYLLPPRVAVSELFADWGLLQALVMCIIDVGIERGSGQVGLSKSPPSPQDGNGSGGDVMLHPHTLM